MSEVKADLTENALVNDLERLQRWQKCPDQPLGDHIEQQNVRREFRDGRKQWIKEKMREATEEGARGYGYSWRGSADDSTFDKY